MQLKDRKRAQDLMWMKDEEIRCGGSVCHMQLKDRKRAQDLMWNLGLNEIIDQLASSVCGYCQLLRKEDGHGLRRALDIEVEGQRGC